MLKTLHCTPIPLLEMVNFVPYRLQGWGGQCAQQETKLLWGREKKMNKKYFLEMRADAQIWHSFNDSNCLWIVLAVINELCSPKVVRGFWPMTCDTSSANQKCISCMYFGFTSWTLFKKKRFISLLILYF